MHDIRKELRSFDSYICFSLRLLFVPHSIHTCISSLLLLWKFVISLSFIFVGYDLLTVYAPCCAVLYLLNIFNKAPLTPYIDIKDRIYLLHSNWGLQSLFDFEHSNKKISWRKTKKMTTTTSCSLFLLLLSKSRYSIHNSFSN